MLGICADPGHPEITADSVLESGAHAVSLVLKSDIDAFGEPSTARYDFAIALRRAGLKILGIVTDETTSPFGSVAEAAEWYRREFDGAFDYLQLLNEPDLVSDSSNTKTQLDALRFVYEWLAGWGPRDDVTVLAGGFASGNPAWLEPIWADLLRVVDGVAIHAYGMNPQIVLSKRHNLVGNRPSTWHWGRASVRAGFGWGFGDLSALVASYQQLPGGPSIYITEIGAHASDFEDERQRAKFTSNTIVELGKLDLGVPSWWFCLGPNMVPGYDLIAPDGTVLESYAAFVNSI